jgi:hypothetical protein
MKTFTPILIILFFTRLSFSQDFSPLDPLGPSYGGINRPTLDIRGMSPFEGENINDFPEINYPEYPTKTPSKPKNKNKKYSSQKISPQELIESLQRKNEEAANSLRDKNEYVEIISYDPNNLDNANQNKNNNELSSTSSSNSYSNAERFFSSPCFHEIGFHPSMNIQSLEKTYSECEWKKTKEKIFIACFITAGLILLIVLFRLATKK